MYKYFLLFLLLTQTFIYAQEQRQVAFTFDDLPYASSIKDINIHTRIINNISHTLLFNKVPATGFIIGEKIIKNGKINPEYFPLFNTWLSAGLDLGNHSYSHKSLNTTPLKEYEEDFMLCDSLIRPFLNNAGYKLKYYRHPYLQTGRDTSIKNSFENFAGNAGYSIAPITIDNSDWIFAKAYEKAFLANDSSMMKYISETFVSYLKSYFIYYESQSNKIFNRNIKHILLLHGNLMHSDNLQKVINMLKDLNYKFVTIDEALTDSAYTHFDTFNKAGGISWLHRWAYSEGKRGDFFKGEPHTPDDIMKYADVESE